MVDLDDIYQEVILDHNRNPRNFGLLDAATHQSVGHNPLCGDKLHLQLRLEDNAVVGAGFTGEGCAIFKASSSMMTEALLGKTRAEAEALYAAFHAMVTGEVPESPAELGKLAAFAGVSDYPARVKCASLAWHTMKAAIDGSGEPVSTE